ncbi:MAG: hypothetical protein GF331_06500 [Chitinivibrionales bacterium]|nr:hypothetical protein [Chitinivibrionales bacterium]
MRVFRVLCPILALVSFSSAAISFSVIDMYANPVAGAAVTAISSRGDTLKAVSDKDGKAAFSCRDSCVLSIRVVKEPFGSRAFELEIPKCSAMDLGTVTMLPADPGLYGPSGSRVVGRHEYKHGTPARRGLMVPAYYDGPYSVSSFDTVQASGDTLVLYWVPEHGRTLRENVFAAKDGIFVYAVDDNGHFVTYAQGRSSAGERLDIQATPIVDDKNMERYGIIQKKIQAYVLRIPLTKPRFVVFQPGGNRMDNEPHPGPELGCYPFVVVK